LDLRRGAQISVGELKKVKEIMRRNVKGEKRRKRGDGEEFEGVFVWQSRPCFRCSRGKEMRAQPHCPMHAHVQETITIGA